MRDWGSAMLVLFLVAFRLKQSKYTFLSVDAGVYAEILELIVALLHCFRMD
jgi:hypothetical protein